jgi:hypothetical protein
VHAGLIGFGVLNWKTSPAIAVGGDSWQRVAASREVPSKDVTASARSAAADDNSVTAAQVTDPAYQLPIGKTSQASFYGVRDPQHYPPSPAIAIGPHEAW